MKYKLICLDIDGTLLTDEKKLLFEVKKSIEKAVEKGIKIALVSGRMPAGVEMIEKNLGISCIKVCSAGTYIIMGEECISNKQILPKTMKSVFIEIAKRRENSTMDFPRKEVVCHK